jgi:hypothetical protein
MQRHARSTKSVSRLIWITIRVWQMRFVEDNRKEFLWENKKEFWKGNSEIG